MLRNSNQGKVKRDAKKVIALGNVEKILALSMSLMTGNLYVTTTGGT
jgi:hypothetical protein